MNINKKNPIRIRSKICFLIYNNLNSFENIKKLLSQAFKVKSDKEWKYIIKIEHYTNGQSNLLVYLEFERPLDIYSNRTSIIIQNEIKSPMIWCLSEPYLALYFLLKSNSSDIKKNILTNMDSQTIDNFLLILS